MLGDANAGRTAVLRPRLAAALMAISFLGGCLSFGGESRPNAAPTARTVENGVETWNLTTDPSKEGLGITATARSATYSTEQPREVILLLPLDARIQATVSNVTFERSHAGSGGGAFRFAARGPTIESADLISDLREISGALRQDRTLAENDEALNAFADSASSFTAYDDQPVQYTSGEIVIGALTVRISATAVPSDGRGEMIITGAWN